MSNSDSFAQALSREDPSNGYLPRWHCIYLDQNFQSFVLLKALPYKRCVGFLFHSLQRSPQVMLCGYQPVCPTLGACLSKKKKSRKAKRLSPVERETEDIAHTTDSSST